MYSIMAKFRYKLLRGWYYLTFDATKRYGERLPYIGKYMEIQGHVVPTILLYRASMRLPKGLYFEIRASMPTDYGRNKGLAWYYVPGGWGKLGYDMKPVAANGAYYRMGGFLA